MLRGKWVLENLLSAAPPPPPPNIPALKTEGKRAGETLSMRDAMTQHRANPACASCHARMDPIGFGLENFDAVGEWRTEDGKFPIEPSGTLTTGQTFKGPSELVDVLAKQPTAFAGAITEKMLTYALGRGLEAYDRPVVKSIVADLAKNDYKFSQLVMGIVNSVPFQRAGAVKVNSAQNPKQGATNVRNP